MFDHTDMKQRWIVLCSCYSYLYYVSIYLSAYTSIMIEWEGKNFLSKLCVTFISTYRLPDLDITFEGDHIFVGFIEIG